MNDFLTCVIKSKSNNTNQIPPFVSSLFFWTKVIAIAKTNVPLEWIKKKDMLTMVNMVKESDEEPIQDTFITSKLLEKPKDEVKIGGI